MAGIRERLPALRHSLPMVRIDGQIRHGLLFSGDSEDCRSREAALPFNPKRRIAAAPDPDALDDLAARVRYGGNPEHKRNPGDFGLTPPARPRADKSKCDWAGIVERAVALRLLREGIRRGLVSEQRRGGYPQNVWALTDDGYPLEAQLENSVSGAYHGYPMPETDPFRDVVLERWTTI